MHIEIQKLININQRLIQWPDAIIMELVEDIESINFELEQEELIVQVTFLNMNV